MRDYTKTLWTRARYPNETQTTVPTKQLSECTTGWFLRFQNYQTGDGATNLQFQFIHIPKIHAQIKKGETVRMHWLQEETYLYKNTCMFLMLGLKDTVLMLPGTTLDLH